jgi:hypothetical protein
LKYSYVNGIYGKVMLIIDFISVPLCLPVGICAVKEAGEVGEESEDGDMRAGLRDEVCQMCGSEMRGHEFKAIRPHLKEKNT